MGEVHQFLASRGRQAALEQLDVDRRVIETAAQYLADEDAGIGWLYSGWCQAALPHRRLPDAAPWQIQSDHTTLAVEPGLRPTPGGRLVPIGVPYGSRARLIMLHLQSEALRTNSREIELGRSLRDWLRRMGIPQGGKSQRDIRDQAERISRCRLTFHVRSGNGKTVGLLNQNVVDAAMFVEDDTADGQGSLFVETAKLSEVFFEQLRRHPVPMEESAVRAIANNSMALDVYAWLAYRMHVLPSPRDISWTALKAQFGTGYGRVDNFRLRFRENLALALAVYPRAQVTEAERGLTLHPSPPPVAPRKKLSY